MDILLRIFSLFKRKNRTSDIVICSDDNEGVFYEIPDFSYWVTQYYLKSS